MNVSYRWLQSLVPGLAEPPAELAHRLSLLGAPADEVVELGAGIEGVVIARVEEVRQHPDADRLRVTRVNAGGETVQVVCGAPNVEAGRYYPFAPVGAMLPGGTTIGRAKLRGEVSEGMLCSARELGLGRDHAGLMTLAGEWEPGAPFLQALGLDDVRLALDITPNRPEMLSHVGVAREVAAGGAADVRLPELPGAPERPIRAQRVEREGEVGGVRVRIEDAEGCPRYTAAVVRGVEVGPSPEWLASRLRAVGVRPINNVVDATNYVLFELGQPVHAFDLDRLRGPEITVRRARPGETLRTLDGVDRALAESALLITDAGGPVALAGVMGGENSEVHEGTTSVLLEVALFDPRAVRGTRVPHGLSTDASYRFERGVDPEGQLRALERVAQLVAAVAGGEVDHDALDVNPVPFTRREVELRPERVEQVLGVRLAPDEIAGLLEAIGFGVDAGASPLRVSVPGFRPDVTAEVDLVEEVARRRGYDSFPEQILPFRASAVPESPQVGAERRARELFRRAGFLESRTTGFAPGAEGRVPVLNPLSSEEGSLRDTLAHGLLRRVEHNWAHGVRDVRLFEVGTVFAPAGDGALPREELRVAAVFTGASRPPHWSGAAAPWDVWDLKGILEELAEEHGAALEVGAPALLGEMLAPGEAFRLAADGTETGGGGRVAPVAVDAPTWAGEVWALEARLPVGREAEAAAYRALPEQPASERDLALLVPRATAAAEVEAVVRASAGPLLEAAWPFDLYEGKGIPGGTRSVAFRLRFRAPDRTLTDAEVDSAVAAVLAALEERLGVRRR
ncbi:MAG TPA: phenylalanine--tRNA ligase subunit beta [Longimicrobiaceae bacterium]|nr:phenylalanine--tRNA ligase subunit beta [Longimicrobiaceae bacterium]